MSIGWFRALGLGFAAATGGCGGREARPRPPAAPNTAAPAAPAAVVVPSAATDKGLNLDFERDDLGPWRVRGDVRVDPAEHHGGSRSLRLAAGGAPARAVLSLPLEGARGTKLRVSGWLRSQDVARGGLFLRAEGDYGDALAVDAADDEAVTGTHPWTRQTVDIDVPVTALTVMVGAVLGGSGTLWLDDLQVEVLPADPAAAAAPAVLRGTVVDPAGKPVAGVLVSAGTHADMARPADATAVTGPDGQFAVTAVPGVYRVTAAAAELTSATSGPARVRKGRDPAPLALALGGPGFTLSGRVSDGARAPVAGTVALYALDTQATFSVASDEDGRYRIRLPAGPYLVTVAAAGRIGEGSSVLMAGDRTLDVVARDRGRVQAPADEAVVAWVKRAAVPLATAVPGGGLDDLRPLRTLIGDATVCALGEATHGSREFTQLKHRLLEYLVGELGFTVLALEAGGPQVEAVNRYVLEGTGDVRAAAAGAFGWPWNTEEMLALVEWARAWNADPAHRRRVQLYGVDIDFAATTVPRLLEYLRGVDPGAAERAAGTLAPLATLDLAVTFGRRPAPERAETKRALAALIAEMDRARPRWVAAAGAPAFVAARHDAVLVQQLVDARQEDAFWGTVRDRAMAENLEWVAKTAQPGARIVAWAHNMHVGRTPYWNIPSMGTYLARAFGRKLVSLGFAFHQGSFQAMGNFGVVEHSVGAGPPGSVDDTLARAGAALLVLDLRGSPVWFRAPRVFRHTGSDFTSDEDMWDTLVPARTFDGVIFVERTTRARPLRPR
jgi:erythromycin esterase